MSKGIEEALKEMLRAFLDDQGITTEEEFEDKETQVLLELEALKEELDLLLLEIIEELPKTDTDNYSDADESETDFDDED